MLLTLNLSIQHGVQHMCPHDACCGLLAFLLWHALHGWPEVADLIGSRPSVAMNCCKVNWLVLFPPANWVSVLVMHPTLFFVTDTSPSLILDVFVFNVTVVLYLCSNSVDLCSNSALFTQDVKLFYFGKIKSFSAQLSNHIL